MQICVQDLFIFNFSSNACHDTVSYLSSLINVPCQLFYQYPLRALSSLARKFGFGLLIKLVSFGLIFLEEAVYHYLI
jgi:hypothetical protein